MILSLLLTTEIFKHKSMMSMKTGNAGITYRWLKLVAVLVVVTFSKLHASAYTSHLVVRVVNTKGLPVMNANVSASHGTRAVTDNQGTAIIGFEALKPGSAVSISIEKPDWVLLFPANAILVSLQLDNHVHQLVVVAKVGEVNSAQEKVAEFFQKFVNKKYDELPDTVVSRLVPYFDILAQKFDQPGKKDSLVLNQISQVLEQVMKVPADSLLNAYDIYWKGLRAYEAGDTIEALKLFHHSAREGESNAQYAIGYHFSGRGGGKTPSDCQKAVKWLRESAAGADVRALGLLAVMYYEGLCLPESKEKAREHLEKAASYGSVTALNNLGVLLRDEGNYEDAFLYFQWAAIQQYPPAKYNLGIMYKKGWGVKKNKEMAESLIRETEELGYKPSYKKK